MCYIISNLYREICHLPDTDQITFSQAALLNLLLRNFNFLLRLSHTLQLTLLQQFDNRVIIFGSFDFGVCLNNLSSDCSLIATSLFLSKLSHFWGVGMVGMQSDSLRCSLQYSSQIHAFKTFWPIISLSRLVNMPSVLVDSSSIINAFLTLSQGIGHKQQTSTYPYPGHSLQLPSS